MVVRLCGSLHSLNWSSKLGIANCKFPISDVWLFTFSISDIRYSCSIFNSGSHFWNCLGLAHGATCQTKKGRKLQRPKPEPQRLSRPFCSIFPPSWIRRFFSFFFFNSFLVTCSQGPKQCPNFLFKEPLSQTQGPTRARWRKLQCRSFHWIFQKNPDKRTTQPS